MDSSISLVIVCPDLSSSTDRVEAACEILESEISGVKLKWTFSSSGKKTRIDRRSSFLASAYANMHPVVEMVCNADDAFPVAISGNFYPDVAGPLGAGSHMLSLLLPAPCVGVLGGLLGRIGDALGAYCACWMPAAASDVLAPVLFSNLSVPSLTPIQDKLLGSGLPRYRREWRSDAIHIPTDIGWLNYWSKATCAYFDFPNKAGDDSVFSIAKETPAGAWLLQLTEEPLKVERATHLQALKTAFSRFEGVMRPARFV